jgi:hypothetical protein
MDDTSTNEQISCTNSNVKCVAFIFSITLSLLLTFFSIAMIVYSKSDNAPYWALISGVWGVWMPTPRMPKRQQGTQAV